MITQNSKGSIPAKILLLGEYTVLEGSRSLAIPYFGLGGSWNFQQVQSALAIASNEALRAFASYLSTSDARLCLRLDAFKADLDSGIWFDANIPKGFGLGSSGAVCAAIVKRYQQNLPKDLEQLQQLFIEMESHFHGKSSGLDPLVGFTQSPLLCSKDLHSTSVGRLNMEDLHLKHWFLIDSKIPRSTEPLVKLFKEKMQEHDFRNSIRNQLIPVQERLLESILGTGSSKEHFTEVSRLQGDLFTEMIPAPIKKIWNLGLASGDFAVKLCGAGGGGFFLGYATNPKAVEAYSPIWIDQ